MTTTETKDYRLRLPALVEYRAAASRRRAEAFCDVPEEILGMPVQPLTPRTFSMLLAVENRFVCGGVPQLEDVVNYVWLHSPTWSHCGVKGWKRRKARVLRPLMVQIAQPWRKWLGLKPQAEHIAAAMALAITDIRGVVERAFADTIEGGGPTKPIATLEAQFVHMMARHYRWEPERTRNTPLRQLFQLCRCIRQANGEDITDPGEAQILADHLRRRNDDLAAERNK